MALDLTRGMPPEARHLARVVSDPATGCWLWTGSDVTNTGYGRFMVNGRRAQVHRWAYEHYVRPLAPGEVIDHLCNTPLCSNPGHLLATSQKANVLRSETALPAVNARKTVCDAGHDLTYAYVRPATGARKCRPCAAQRQREYLARKREVRHRA